MDRLFVDTGAFVALAATHDAHHSEAKLAYERLVRERVPMVTSNHIVDETCTWLARHPLLGHPAAARYGAFLRDATSAYGGMTEGLLLEVVFSTSEVEKLAWQIFETYPDSRLTFTDCVSFAMMRSMGISHAFAYDSHFDMLGFVRVTG